MKAVYFSNASPVQNIKTLLLLTIVLFQS